jgi:hypothetical protein
MYDLEEAALADDDAVELAKELADAGEPRARVGGEDGGEARQARQLVGGETVLLRRLGAVGGVREVGLVEVHVPVPPSICLSVRPSAVCLSHTHSPHPRYAVRLRDVTCLGFLSSVSNGFPIAIMRQSGALVMCTESFWSSLNGAKKRDI